MKYALPLLVEKIRFWRTVGFLTAGLILSIWTSISSAANICESVLVTDRAGGLFLHQREPKLHLSSTVDRTAKQLGLKSQKPGDRIIAWLERMRGLLAEERQRSPHFKILKKWFYETYVTEADDIPESYYQAQLDILRTQGQHHVVLTKSLRRMMAKTVINDQKKSLKQWLTYFVSPEADAYPMWTKYWSLMGVLKLAKYDPDTGTFGSRDHGQIAPFPELNREALALVMDAIVNKVNRKSLREIEDIRFMQLLEGGNFGKLYGRAIYNLNLAKGNSLTSENGEWVTFKRQSDYRPLVKSLVGMNTGWCTAGEATAISQLEDSDFHIFYNYDENGKPRIPRIAIRMVGSKIIEVRGIAKNQNLDPHILETEVFPKKLAELGEDAKTYLAKLENMRIVGRIEQKVKLQKDLDLNELRILYQIDEASAGFGYEEDPRLSQIIEMRNPKSDLARIFGINEAQVSTTRAEALAGGIKYHYGDLDLDDRSTLKGVEFPEIVGGDIFLSNLTSIDGLRFPKEVKGSLVLSRLTNVDGVKFPEKVGGELNLEEVVSAEGVELPKYVGLTLNLDSLRRCKKLVLPAFVGVHVHLASIEMVQAVTFPKRIGRSLFLDELTFASGINLPEYVGGDLHLSKLREAERVNFPLIVGGILKLGWLTSATEVSLPKLVGQCLELESLRAAERVIFPEVIKTDLKLNGLTLVKQVQLPRIVKGSLQLNSLPMGDGLKFPDLVGRDVELISLRSGYGLLLPKEVGGSIIFNHKANLKGASMPIKLGGRVVTW